MSGQPIELNLNSGIQFVMPGNSQAFQSEPRLCPPEMELAVQAYHVPTFVGATKSVGEKALQFRLYCPAKHKSVNRLEFPCNSSILFAHIYDKWDNVADIGVCGFCDDADLVISVETLKVRVRMSSP